MVEERIVYLYRGLDEPARRDPTRYGKEVDEMNEDRSRTRQSILSRVFAGFAEGEQTAISSEEVGAPAAHGFTVEGAAEVIKNLPSDVPRPAAVRIVRGTLEAAGIDMAELESLTRAAESRLNSEIGHSEGRIRQLEDETEEVIRNLQDEIRKAREARNFGISDEERKIASAEAGRHDIDMVREFFGMPQEDSVSPADPAAGEEKRVVESVEVEEDETRVLRRHDPLSDPEDYGNTRDNKE